MFAIAWRQQVTDDGKEMSVLNITPEAASTIQTLLSDREGGGLRIFVATPRDDNSRLTMGLSLTSDPDPSDEVVTAHGSQVFVEKRLSSVLADKTLDVAEPDDERVGFRLVS
jgi:Fe-S cluster assembly iron-binding protein IscA